MFRPDCNMERLNLSMARCAMPGKVTHCSVLYCVLLDFSALNVTLFCFSLVSVTELNFTEVNSFLIY